MLVILSVGAMWQVWHCFPWRRAGLSNHSEYVLYTWTPNTVPSWQDAQ
jgi:hypothetical protein